MKKLIFILFLFVFYSCSEKLNSDNSIKKLKVICEIGEPEVLNNGAIHYSFNTNFDNEIKIKGCFDKGLGILPQKVKEHKTAAIGGHILNLYEYETIEEQITVENHFMKDYGTDSLYIECKIWIIKK